VVAVIGWVLWGMVGIVSMVVAWQDFVFQRIGVVWVLLLGGLMGVLSVFSSSGGGVWWWGNHLLGALVPAGVLAVGANQHKAGWGDVWIALVLGWYVGVPGLGWWLLSSLVGAWGHVAVSLWKRKKNPRIPFVSWMVIGFWGYLGGRLVGVWPLW